MRFRLCLALLIPMMAAAQPAGKALSILNASVQQYEDGPPLPASHRFVAGETVFFSFQVAGYSLSTDQRVLLTYRIDTFDSEEVRLVESASGKLEAGITDMDKDWRPRIRHMFSIPSYAPAGEYRIAAWVKDETGGLEASVTLPLNVQGRTVEKSDHLVIRNLRFFRSETDREPFSPASYRGGDRLWARFDVTGYRLGEKNRMDVSYGLSILSSSGKVLFTEKLAAQEADAPFYPKRFFEGIVSLSVQPKTTPGEYTLVVSARDEVGGQTAEARGAFRIE